MRRPCRGRATSRAPLRGRVGAALVQAAQNIQVVFMIAPLRAYSIIASCVSSGWQGITPSIRSSSRAPWSPSPSRQA